MRNKILLEITAMDLFISLLLVIIACFCPCLVSVLVLTNVYQLLWYSGKLRTKLVLQYNIHFNINFSMGKKTTCL